LDKLRRWKEAYDKRINIQELELDLGQLHRRVVGSASGIGNVNYALREKRRELEMLGADP
jgi:hypothetical protein